MTNTRTAALLVSFLILALTASCGVAGAHIRRAVGMPIF